MVTKVTSVISVFADVLREQIDFTEAVLSELKLAVYLFHDSVSRALRVKGGVYWGLLVGRVIRRNSPLDFN